VPELPEVETVRRGLQDHVVGRRVDHVVVTGQRSVRRHGSDALIAGLNGRRLASASRRGKYLLVGLGGSSPQCRWHPEPGPQALVVHLRMSGQLRLVRAPAGSVAVAAHTHVRLWLDDGSELRFVDPRTFGELFVTGELDGRGVPAVLAGLGPDPLVEGIDPERLWQLATRRRASLKAFLIDQAVLAGVGNLYADEACFRARLRPGRSVGGLRRAEVFRLARALEEVLGEAVAAGGSTLRDARYVDLDGHPGSFQDHHAVYGREGEPCLGCGHPIRRIRVSGRSSHFCPTCQR